MSNTYSQAKSVCITILSSSTGPVNSALIKQTIDKVMLLFLLPAEEQKTLFEALETLYAVFSDQYRILDDGKPLPWIKNAKAEISWNFWNRYRMLLELKNYAPDTINKLDELTDELLDRLIRPGDNHPFDKRGLIVGQVQSGKTGNYIGLICKAADAGYKLIIVLAGIHNTLRSQTQLRIDEGFLGFDTQQARNFARTSNRIGVGKFNPNLAAHSLTTNEIVGDFNRRASESSGINIRGNDPIILVIKKNAAVMKNLLGWLASRGETMADGKKQIKNLPLLVIDDEADNASINISKSYVSSINACIRSLLRLFEQSAYVGYTATPYANIFIKQYEEADVKGLDYSVNNIPLSLGKDVFPKNFIVNIPAPSNYIGPEKIFGIVSTEQMDKNVEPLPLVKLVNDYMPLISEGEKGKDEYLKNLEEIRQINKDFIPDSHREKDALPEEIPNSLKSAIKCFFLCCAARRARGQATEHNSMLIHVSRFNRWQDRIASLVLNEVKFCARQIEFNQPEFLRELEKIWNGEFVPVTRKIIDNPDIKDPGIVEVSWQELLNHLYSASAKIEVRAVHGDTRIDKLEFKNIRPLDYYDNQSTGLSVIAVGGNKLSRGLTMEGLTVSYFLRSSKMYDTLMQMGRWFGYRLGYLDLCRLFTSAELSEWYQHVIVATEEMRAEFDRMGDLDKTPAEYGLKVRTHPGVLAITAANKFRYKKIMELSFSGELEETYSFRKQSNIHINNYNLTLKLINDLGLPGKSPNTNSYFKNHFVWQGKNNADQLVSYLSAYVTHQPSFNVKLITDYILAQQKADLLKNWTIALINSAGEKKQVTINHSIRVGLTIRRDNSPADHKYYMVNKSHIIDPWHEFIDLTDRQSETAFAESVADAKKNGRDAEKLRYPSLLRIKMNRPGSNGLLLIYILDPKPENDKPAVAEVPVIGLAISFPYLRDDKKIEYAVNEQFIKELDYPDQLDDYDTDENAVEEINDNNEVKLDAIRNEMQDGYLMNKNFSFSFLIGKKVRFSIHPEIDFTNSDILIAVPEKQKSSGSIPLIRSEDIDKYQSPAFPDFWIADTRYAHEDEQGIIVAPAVYKKASFTLVRNSFQIDESCIAIKTIRESSINKLEFRSEYLLAVLNSVVFSFWIIMMDSRVKDTQMLVTSFPFKNPPQGHSGIQSLVNCILMLLQDRASRDNQVMAAYFMNIVDAAILEVYFPAEFELNKLYVLQELALLLPFEGGETQARYYYGILNNPNHPVKKAVYALTGIDKFRLIYNSLNTL